MATLVWSTFSGAFETGAIYTLPNSSIIFNILMNVVEYGVFTVICYYVAFPPKSFMRAVNPLVADSKIASRLPNALRDAMTVKRMAPVQVVAVCFCGAAKTTSVGIPLVAAMWSELDNFTISSIQVPVLLYTVEQVFLAQFFTIFFRHWMDKTTKSITDTESTAPDDPLCAAEPADPEPRGESRKLE
ncbi:LRR receptor-like serine/threonine-protein kinase RGI2 [Diatrype stigma]|uniref:LRR receptor-like serine/threonine-protein kinase RGI2 n=1 Tax=Diatrype stigma TaxID=117547 RepID=A0AAN9UG62_9PEZI